MVTAALVRGNSCGCWSTANRSIRWLCSSAAATHRSWRWLRVWHGRGYDEINLNVGCPSDRVQSGRFGACLMREPTLVGDCVKAMRERSDVPVTVKCRIGVDDQDDDGD